MHQLVEVVGIDEEVWTISACGVWSVNGFNVQQMSNKMFRDGAFVHQPAMLVQLFTALQFFTTTGCKELAGGKPVECGGPTWRRAARGLG